MEMFYNKKEKEKNTIMLFITHLINKDFYILFFPLAYLIFCSFVYLIFKYNFSFLYFDFGENVLSNWGGERPYIYKFCAVISIFACIVIFSFQIFCMKKRNYKLNDFFYENKTFRYLTWFWTYMCTVCVVFIILTGVGDLKASGYYWVWNIQVVFFASLFLTPDLLTKLK